jgi:hypothetical protein
MTDLRVAGELLILADEAPNVSQKVIKAIALAMLEQDSQVRLKAILEVLAEEPKEPAKDAPSEEPAEEKPMALAEEPRSIPASKVALKTGSLYEDVAAWCRDNGIAKAGRGYILTRSEAESYMRSIGWI